MITAAKSTTPDNDTLERAIATTPGDTGAAFDQIITEYERTAGPVSATEFPTALHQLVADGHISRTKGPRGENLYRIEASWVR